MVSKTIKKKQGLRTSKHRLAHCDSSTGKIYGCKKGSWKWYHEKGHLIFNEEKSLLLLLKQYIHGIWIFFIMCALVIPKTFYLALLSWIIYFSLFIYEEWWCNQYANRKVYKYVKLCKTT